MTDRIDVVEMPLPTVWQRRQTAALERLGVRVRYVEGFYRTSYLPWFQLPRELLRGYDVFHVHWIPFWSKALLNGFLKTVPRSRPLVWQFHNLWAHKPQFGSESADIAWTKRCWERADARLVHSERNVADFAGYGMTGADVVPLGNLHGHFPRDTTRAAARERMGFREDETVVGFFGPTGPYKGADVLVEALRRVPEVKGFVFGHCPDAGLKAHLAEAAHALDGRLKLDLSRISDADLQHYFLACDLVAVPYRRITTSGSVFFPAAFGVPVVGSRQGNIPDVVVEGTTGFLADGAQELAEVLRGVAGKRDDLAAMGERFEKDVAARFDWDVIARRTVAIYRRLLGEDTVSR